MINDFNFKKMLKIILDFKFLFKKKGGGDTIIKKYKVGTV